jgi:hypothetical protein
MGGFDDVDGQGRLDSLDNYYSLSDSFYSWSVFNSDQLQTEHINQIYIHESAMKLVQKSNLEMSLHHGCFFTSTVVLGHLSLHHQPLHGAVLIQICEYRTVLRTPAHYSRNICEDVTHWSPWKAWPLTSSKGKVGRPAELRGECVGWMTKTVDERKAQNI